MKNFKLYTYINNNPVLITNSRKITAAASFEETCSITENEQVSFSCKIVKNISPSQPNLYYKYFYPNAKLRLDLFDYQDKLENSYDLVITSCNPEFYHDNEILNIEAIDYAQYKFSRTGSNLVFEQSGNIYELSTQLLADTGLNTYYQGTTNNRFLSSDMQIITQSLIEERNTLFQKYYWDSNEWDAAVQQEVISTADQEIMDELIDDFEQEQSLELLLKITSLFSKYIKTEYDAELWHEIYPDQGTTFVTLADANLMQEYNDKFTTAEQNSSNCEWTANGLKLINPNNNVYSSYFTYTITEDIPDGIYNFKFMPPANTVACSIGFGSAPQEIEQYNTGFVQGQFIIERVNDVAAPLVIYIGLEAENEDPVYLKELHINKVSEQPDDTLYWTVNEECLNDFINNSNEENPYYYIKNGLNLNGSNLYNGLIELTSLFNATIHFDYEEKIINFDNKENRTYKGIKFNPDVNINSFSRPATSDELATQIDIYGNEIADQYINLIGTIPLPLRVKLLEYMEHNFTNSVENEGEENEIIHDYFEFFEEGKYTEIANEIIQSGYVSDETELLDYCSILDQIPNFENRIYNLDYFFRIGALNEDDMSVINDYINNKLRKVNIKLKVMSEQYNEAVSSLSLLTSNLNYYATLASTTEREINVDTWEINDLTEKISDPDISQDLIDKYTVQITAYQNSMASAKVNLNNYKKQIAQILGVFNELIKKRVKNNITQIGIGDPIDFGSGRIDNGSSRIQQEEEQENRERELVISRNQIDFVTPPQYEELILTDPTKECLYNVLMTIYGYNNSNDNGYIRKYNETKAVIEEKEQELNKTNSRIDEIDELVTTIEDDSVSATLAAERASLLSYAISLFHELGTDIHPTDRFLPEYEYALEMYDALKNKDNKTAEEINEMIKWKKRMADYEQLAKEGSYKGSLYYILDGYKDLQDLYESQNNVGDFKTSTKIGLYNYLVNYDHEKNLYKEKDNILREFSDRYGEYLIEGYYQSTDATNSNELFQEAMIITNKVSYPTISYNIGVIDLSSLENYKFLKIAIGDRITLDNRLYLKYNPNYQDFLEITGIDYILRQPDSTTLTVDKQDLDDRLISYLFTKAIGS